MWARETHRAPVAHPLPHPPRLFLRAARGRGRGRRATGLPALRSAPAPPGPCALPSPPPAASPPPESVMPSPRASSPSPRLILPDPARVRTAGARERHRLLTSSHGGGGREGCEARPANRQAGANESASILQARWANRARGRPWAGPWMREGGGLALMLPGVAAAKQASPPTLMVW
ncbi:unnamed protein product [Urochloa humidicola]